jgi:hypothetical protein
MMTFVPRLAEGCVKTCIHLKCNIEGNKAPITLKNLQWRSQNFALVALVGARGITPEKNFNECT